MSDGPKLFIRALTLFIKRASYIKDKSLISKPVEQHALQLQEECEASSMPLHTRKEAQIEKQDLPVNTLAVLGLETPLTDHISSALNLHPEPPPLYSEESVISPSSPISSFPERQLIPLKVLSQPIFPFKLPPLANSLLSPFAPSCIPVSFNGFSISTPRDMTLFSKCLKADDPFSKFND